MIQPTQAVIEFGNKEQKIFKAKSALWQHFFDHHNLMLLDEHISDILEQVDIYHKSINNNKIQPNEQSY